MLVLNVFVVAFLLIFQLCQCTGEEIQYSYKVVSDTKEDCFGRSLATAHQRLVVGAPWGNYVLVEPGVKVRAPRGNWFGLYLDVNEHFMVVSGREPHSVYVFSSTHPYTLVARIPLDDYVFDVKVSYDNTIYVATSDFHHHGHVSIYDYNHRSAWSRKQKIVLEAQCGGVGDYIFLAVSGDILAVGYYAECLGRVNIYNKDNNQYILTTTLRPTEHVSGFGRSVAMEGQHLVVSSSRSYDDKILFTYELDPSERKWKMNGRITVPSPHDNSYVSLQNNTLAATVTDRPHRRNSSEVCAYVYKVSNNNDHDAITTTNNSVINTKVNWKKVATLKTNGVPLPMTGAQYHGAISIQDGLIFTGRWVNSDRGYGMVFVHDMNKH